MQAGGASQAAQNESKELNVGKNKMVKGITYEEYVKTMLDKT